MKQAKEVKRKIKSITSIRHITRAMKMVAAAKFKKAQNRMSAISAYYKRIKEAIGDMSDYLLEHRHPYVAKQVSADVHHHGGVERTDRVRCFVVISGDKGLCGAFNMNICREAEAQMKKAKVENFETILITIGTKCYDYFHKRKYKIFHHSPLTKPDPKFEDIQSTINSVLEVFENGHALEVHVVYTHYVSTITYKVTTEKILPIEFDKSHFLPNAIKNDFKFEPGPSEVIDYLLPRYIKMRVFASIVESSCSEQGSRMLTMGSATDKASEMISHLTLMLNRARQESITAELLDIVGGVEALKKSS